MCYFCSMKNFFLLAMLCVAACLHAQAPKTTPVGQMTDGTIIEAPCMMVWGAVDGLGVSRSGDHAFLTLHPYDYFGQAVAERYVAMLDVQAMRLLWAKEIGGQARVECLDEGLAIEDGDSRKLYAYASGKRDKKTAFDMPEPTVADTAVYISTRLMNRFHSYGDDTPDSLDAGLRYKAVAASGRYKVLQNRYYTFIVGGDMKPVAMLDQVRMVSVNGDNIVMLDKENYLSVLELRASKPRAYDE